MTFVQEDISLSKKKKEEKKSFSESCNCTVRVELLFLNGLYDRERSDVPLISLLAMKIRRVSPAVARNVFPGGGVRVTEESGKKEHINIMAEKKRNLISFLRG